MELTIKDKQYLKSIGYEARDFKQIEIACNTALIYIYESALEKDKRKYITSEDVILLIGREFFLSAISRAAFHYDTGRCIPNTNDKYTIHFDCGNLFGREIIDYHVLPIQLKSILTLQNKNKEEQEKIESETSYY